MTSYIIIKTQFPAIHNWDGVTRFKEELKDVQFLIYPHRHVFYVTIRFKVTHADRQIEFINAKNRIEAYIQKYYYGKDIGSKSCEMIAGELLIEFGAYHVKVLEDNENGGEIYDS